jgi:hypothetical protein
LSSSLQTHLPYSITLNGLSSPESDLDLRLTKHSRLSTLMPAQRHDSMAQQPTTLITFNFKFEMRLRLFPLNVCTDVAGDERCSCIILLTCKIHELLLMCFHPRAVEILLDPKQISGAVHLLHLPTAASSVALLLLLLFCPASPFWQSLLTLPSAS